jgi:hypothetical protein
MPKRSRKHDDIQNALRVVEEAIGEPLVAQPEQREKDPLAVALGRRGGRKGGKARAANLSTEQLSNIGKMGAKARWGNRKHSRNG